MDATIAVGATESDTQNLWDRALVGFLLPASMTGTEISFKVARGDADTFLPLKDSEGNVVKFTFAASTAIGLAGSEADALAAFQYVRLVSNVIQAATPCVIGLALK